MSTGVGLKTQRDDYMKHLNDMQTEYATYQLREQNNQLEPGHGKYLLLFPEVLDSLAEVVDMRSNQIAAAQNFSHTKFVNLYMLQRRMLQLDMLQAPHSDPASLPNRDEVRKMSRFVIVQHLTDDLGIDHNTLDTELSTVQVKIS